MDLHFIADCGYDATMVSCISGGFGSGRGADVTPGDMSEEEVFEYLLEEVASYERNDHVRP